MTVKSFIAVSMVIVAFVTNVRAETAPSSESDASNSSNAMSTKRPANKAGARTQAKSDSKKSASGVAAVVKTDGALVYDQPDFDANVLATLNEGDRVRVSRGAVGEFAKFHRIRVGAVLGYISDVDVALEGGSLPSAAGPAAKKNSKRAKAESRRAHAKKDKEKREREPMAFSRFLGVTIGLSEFKGAGGSASLLTYGLKVTGPDTLFEGPLTDFTVALHYGAPSFLDSRAVGKPSGFVLFTDLHLLLPFVQHDNSIFYVGVGPLLVISSFKYVTSKGTEDLTAYNPGVSLSLGGGFRVEKVALRLEGKYLFEKQTYKTLNLVLLTEF